MCKELLDVVYFLEQIRTSLEKTVPDKDGFNVSDESKSTYKARRLDADCAGWMVTEKHGHV